MKFKLPFKEINYRADGSINYIYERKFVFLKKIQNSLVICGLFYKNTKYNEDGTIYTINEFIGNN